MKSVLRSPRMPSKLSDSVHQRLNMYAIAAGAAGVGAIALAQPAEGKIVYTSAHKIIPNFSSYSLDLNNDGKADFIIANWPSTSGSLAVCPDNTKGSCIRYQEPHANAIWGKLSGRFRFASALAAGFEVGPSYTHFHRRNYRMVAEFCGTTGSCVESSGPWKGDLNRKYLGFKFFVKGHAHYGWARLNVSFIASTGSLTATLTGYAYETIANKPLITGKTKGVEKMRGATLGALAAGTSGLSMWGRK